jgi:hypothetical protein
MAGQATQSPSQTKQLTATDASSRSTIEGDNLQAGQTGAQGAQVIGASRTDGGIQAALATRLRHHIPQTNAL